MKFLKILLTLCVLFSFCIAQEFVHSAELQCVESADNHDAFTYLLIDRSDKIQDTTAIDQLLSTIESSVPFTEKGERLIVGVITGKVAETRIVMDKVYPAKSIWASGIRLRKKKREFKKCFDLIKDYLLTEKESHDTSAILETLSFVSKTISLDKTANKRLIIYSDMIQNSEVLSFYRNDLKEIDPVLSFIEKQKLLPSFDGTAIFVAGTGGILPDNKGRKIEEFWRQYFIKTNAELKFYGPVLTNL